MDQTGNFIRGLAILIVAAALAGWVLIRWLQTTKEAPGKLVLKWILTVLVIVFVMAPLGVRLTTTGQGGAFLMVFVAAGGLMLAMIWTPTIVHWVSDKFESIFTGGDTPPEPEPFYSTAQARRKQGRYDEAIAAIQQELEKFPGDVTGHIMLAEIHALDQRDMEAARAVVERFCGQPGHAPRNVAMALNALADWHLKINRDSESARQALMRIQELLPETEQATLAAQRLAHLTDDTLDQIDRATKPLPMRAGIKNIGLMSDSARLRPPEEDPDMEMARLLDQLEDHPLAWEVREKLAVLYARHLQNLELAKEQLEILLGQSSQPARQIVKWLNLLADLQIEAGESEETVRATLERVVELNPNAAAAQNARQRQGILNLEIKGKEKGRVVKLGTYEQNIGLRKPTAPPESAE